MSPRNCDSAGSFTRQPWHPFTSTPTNSQMICSSAPGNWLQWHCATGSDGGLKQQPLISAKAVGEHHTL